MIDKRDFCVYLCGVIRKRFITGLIFLKKTVRPYQLLFYLCASTNKKRIMRTVNAIYPAFFPTVAAMPVKAAKASNTRIKTLPPTPPIRRK